jgi:hypothetical protein
LVSSKRDGDKVRSGALAGSNLGLFHTVGRSGNVASDELVKPVSARFVPGGENRISVELD